MYSLFGSRSELVPYNKFPQMNGVFCLFCVATNFLDVCARGGNGVLEGKLGGINCSTSGQNRKQRKYARCLVRIKQTQNNMKF